VSTPVSSPTPYALAADMLDRYDWTTIGKLLVDGRGTTAPDKSDLVDNTSPEGSKLYELLKSSSGLVESAAMMGGKYAPADLMILTGNQQSLLKDIVCDLTIFKLYKRRPAPDTPIPAATQAAMNWLSALEDGTTIFGLQEVIDATHLKIDRETPQVVDQRNQWTRQAAPYFGRRGNRGGGV
jgi:hypothetical protein